MSVEVFLTGGTGYIGSAVLRELVDAGHRVSALNRSPDRRGDLEARGVRVVPGDLQNPDSYREAASEADVLVHTAFDYGANVKADAAALDTLIGALVNARPTQLIYTSGCWVLGETGEEPAAETASTDEPAEVVTWRVGHERRTLNAGSDDARTVVLRPGVVYGGEGGLTAHMFDTAVTTGAAEYIGTGDNHWTLVHVRDLARLYRTVIEARAEGVLHGVDDEPMRVAAIARAASEAAGAGGAVRTRSLADARDAMGPVADAMVLDQRLAAPAARALGWRPERPSFGAAATDAFAEWSAATSGSG